MYLAGTQRLKFCVHESKFYLTGCREGGVMANMAAMYNPAVWAGVVSVGGSEVPEDYRRRRQRISAPIWTALSTKHTV